MKSGTEQHVLRAKSSPDRRRPVCMWQPEHVRLGRVAVVAVLQRLGDADAILASTCRRRTTDADLAHNARHINPL